MNAKDIIWELIGLAEDPHKITLARRGGEPGYIRVWETDKGLKDQDCKVQIELYNGAVTFREELAGHFDGTQRRPTDQNIKQHPLGTSAGPTATFSHGVAPDDLAKHYRTPQAVAKAIMGALRAPSDATSS